MVGCNSGRATPFLRRNRPSAIPNHQPRRNATYHSREAVQTTEASSDITYIPMARGFVYLTAVVDWFSRRVLSHRVSITMEAAFCVEALEEALAKHGTRSE